MSISANRKRRHEVMTQLGIDDPVRGVRKAWRSLADTSCRTYSPLYDEICRTVARDDGLLEVLASAPPEARDPVLVLAAVHFMLLGGLDHPLAAVYAGASSVEPGPLFADLCREHRDDLLRLLPTRHVNTNEVGRSALLGPALTLVAARHGAPLAHLDVGCSAGLNLLGDRYLLDYGPAGVTGTADAPVRIECEVVGGTPPIAPGLPRVVRRVGLDRAPVDVHDGEDVRWLLACVWPDTRRMERTVAALAEARRTPLTLLEGDAVDDVQAALVLLPDDAVAVVTTTWVTTYLPPAARAGFRAALAAASRRRTIAWVSVEAPGVVKGVGGDTRGDVWGVEASVLGLVTFVDGDARPELLGLVHPHGSTLEWRAG
jgi:hypothetical protein